MKNLIFLIFCSIILISCGKKEDSTSKKSTSETTVEKSDTPPPSTTTSEEGTTKDIESKSEGIDMHKFSKNDLPSSIKYKGKIVDGVSWTDKNGDNILIITQTSVRNINADMREQYLYAYHYINYDDGYSQLWSITDFVKSYCDVEAEYIPNSLEIIDIDNDGSAESLFIYKLDGRCDVSPLAVKLMMHKGDTKLVIRGTIGFDEYDGRKTKGHKDFDAAFKNVSSSFKNYASEKWDKFVKNYK